jgi:hypothetical protein
MKTEEKKVKARLYSVRRKDGYQEWTDFIFAPSKNFTDNEINNRNVRSETPKFEKWIAPHCFPDENLEILFTAQFNDRQIIVRDKDCGYEYLTLQKHKDVKNIKNSIDDGCI